MRRFEFSGGSSNKFWQVKLEGTSFLVEWGKIGTAGQSQTKSFGSAAQAKAACDKLIAEKTKKGYVEVNGVAAPAAPAAAAAAAAKAETTTKAASENDTAPAAASAPSAPRAAAQAPASSFDPAPVVVMTDEQRAQRDEWFRPIVDLPNLDPEALLTSARELFDKLECVQSFTAGRSHGDDTGRAVADYALASYAVAKRPDKLDAALEAGTALLGRNWELQRVLVSFWVAAGGFPFAIEAFSHVRDSEWEWDYQSKAASPIWLKAVDPATNWNADQTSATVGSVLAGLLARADQSSRDAAHAHAAKLRPVLGLPTRIGLSILFKDEAWAREDASEFLTLSGVKSEVPNALIYLLRDRAQLDAFAKRGLLEHPMALVANAGADSVGVLAHALNQQYWRDQAAAALACIEGLEAASAMATALDKKDCAETARAYFERRPDLGIAALAPIAASGSKLAAYAEPLLKSLLRDHPELVEPLSSALEPKARAWIAAQRSARKLTPAKEGDLPRELVSPPWRAPRPTQGLPTLKLEVASPYVPPTWDRDRRAAIVSRKQPYGWILKQAGIPEKHDAGTPKIDALVDAALKKMTGYYRASIAHLASDAFLLGKLDSGTTLGLDADYWFARFGEKLWPKCVDILADNAQEVMSTFKDVPEPRLARAVAFALDKKTQKKDAVVWLHEHAELAALGLIPLAFNDDKHERAAAQKALRVIASKARPALEKVATQYGPDAEHAVAALLALPADEYPTKLPAAPKFLDLESLPPVGLRNGKGDLPLSAVAHLITAIQLSPLEQPLSILPDIVEALDPEDAAELAWALFSAWLGAGASSKEGWAFWAVGYLGNDGTARRLTPMIRAWPGESAHARAVSGLDVLATIGSDVALMHLHGIAQKLKFKALQERAREKIQAVAEARGLTADELADRLVPDLGLDDSGSLTLDYGPRQFVVGFDQALKPFVRDGAGKTLADPPKPGKSDDPERAAAAFEQFKLLKKDAKAVAQSQILRLELIMCSGRRFDAAAFQNFFLDHPLMIHIVRRVLWGVYSDGKLVSAFRVAEDRALADASDNAYTLPANATLGVVHRLDLDDATCAAWAQVFGDYEILQPFDQLGRAIFRPTDAERTDRVLRRVSGVTVKTGKILGLDSRGWYRGAPQDAGWVWDMNKPLGGGFHVELALGGGFCVGYMEGTPPEQALGDVVLTRASGAEGEVTFGALPPGVFSELVRDLEGLRE